VDTPVVISVMGNDSDPDGDEIHVDFINRQPANGTVTINPDGTVTYTPNPGFTGTDTFTYILEDDNGGRDEATVTVHVADDDPGMPTGTDLPDRDLTEGEEITPIDVSGHFSDPTGQPLTFTAIGLPAGLVIDPTTGVITGIPENDTSEKGPYEVLVTVTDPDGNQVTRPMTINVVNPGPQANDDVAYTGVDNPVQIAPLANDNDPDGDELTLTVTSGLRQWRAAAIAAVMSIRCMTLPPRMFPRILASLGRTISVVSAVGAAWKSVVSLFLEAFMSNRAGK